MRLLRLSGILQGMPGSLRVVARQRQAAGLRQSSAGLEVHRELVIYPISTLPEHLHSTSLSHAETT